VGTNILHEGSMSCLSLGVALHITIRRKKNKKTKNASCSHWKRIHRNFRSFYDKKRLTAKQKKRIVNCNNSLIKTDVFLERNPFWEARENGNLKSRETE
ncbi:hypothetical protein, partial [Shouchella clausii]|uniref:hypothetical protein n=1 Tax=Shouchella clausii TaxID=79880 RepID=UPI00226D1D56